MNNDLEVLTQILSTMDIPAYRISDLNWLNRNMGIRNSNHPRYHEAREILNQALASKIRKKDKKNLER